MITNKESNFVSVVAYIHNNAGQITEFLNGTLEQLEKHFKKYEVIFVDDFSTDESSAVIKEYIEEKSKTETMTKTSISVIHMSRYHGMERAMQAGIDLSIGDFIFEFDRLDLNYPKELFMQIYYKSLEGYDIVAASPNGTVDFFSEIYYKIYNRYAVSKSSSSLRRETFRVLSRRAINRVKSLNKTVPYRKVVYHSCGLNDTYLCYDTKGNQEKKYSKEVKDTRKDLAMDSLILFTDVVQKISIALSILFVIFTVCVGTVTVLDYLSPNKPVEGWAPIMGFLAAGFSGVFILFSIVLKYLSVILNMVFNKQTYLIQSIEKLTN